MHIRIMELKGARVVPQDEFPNAWFAEIMLAEGVIRIDGSKSLGKVEITSSTSRLVVEPVAPNSFNVRIE